MSWQAAAFALLALALGGGFAWYERARPDARMVALVATLAALAALGRIAFAALPNVKPTTDVVLIAGFALGPGPGFAVGAVAGLTSNFFFGQGPWTPWQMAGWGITGLLGAWLALAGAGRWAGRAPSRWLLAGVCAVVGFGFTVMQDVGDWVTYSDHSSSQLAVYVGKGLGFDAVHAVGCLLFALAFGPALARSVGRFATRSEVTWLPAPHLLSIAAVLAMAGGLVTALPSGRASAASGPRAPVAYLLSAQNPAGGLGAAPGQASTPLYSGWAAMALASAGVSPARVVRDGHSLAGYLLGKPQGRDAGSLERTILALRAGGVSGGEVSALAHAVRRDGSVAEQANLTAFAVLAFSAAHQPIEPKTESWLVRQQDHDGGFNYGTAGGASDIDDTAAVLEALEAAGTGSTARSRAAKFLVSHQNRDGGFPSSPGQDSNAQSTAWAVQGLLAAGGPSRAVDRARAYLSSLIAPDGHIRYARGDTETPVWVTAEALMALERKPLPIAPVALAASAPRSPGHRNTVHRRQRGTRRRQAHHPLPPARAAATRPAQPSLQLVADAGVLAALALAPVGL